MSNKSTSKASKNSRYGPHQQKPMKKVTIINRTLELNFTDFFDIFFFVVEQQIKLLESLTSTFEQILHKDNALLMKVYDKLMNLHVQTSNFTRAKYWCEKSI